MIGKGKTMVDIERDKYLARQAVAKAIRQDLIPKASAFLCRFCYAKARDYHHYMGYSEPHWLDVIPLCRKCHLRTIPDKPAMVREKYDRRKQAEQWEDLARERGLRLPPWDEPPTISNMRTWLHKVGLNQGDWERENGCKLAQFPVLNPQWPLWAFAGLTLQYLADRGKPIETTSGSAQ